MSTSSKLGGGNAIALALLIATAGSASAFNTDRAEWIRYLQSQRDGSAPAAPPVARTGPEMRDVGIAPGRFGLRGELPIGAGIVVRDGARPAAISTAPAATARPKAVRQMDPAFLPVDVSYTAGYAPGTIVIDTEEKYLYLVKPGGTARRYGVGVGRPGFQWSGTHKITMKQEWPGWTPPPQMRKRQPELPAYMEGGPNNPLGARAMYLGSTLYRIHGSNAPWSIGHEVSSGCIRMRNEDVIELYDQVKVGTKVVVLR